MNTDSTINQCQNKKDCMLNSISGNFEFGEWIWYVYEERIAWSDGFSLLLGLEPSTDASFDLLVKCIYPPDLHKVFDSIGLYMLDFKSRWLSFRIIRPDKSIHELRCYLEGIKNNSKGMTELVGLCFGTAQ